MEAADRGKEEIAGGGKLRVQREKRVLRRSFILFFLFYALSITFAIHVRKSTQTKLSMEPAYHEMPTLQARLHVREP